MLSRNVTPEERLSPTSALVKGITNALIMEAAFVFAVVALFEIFSKIF